MEGIDILNRTEIMTNPPQFYLLCVLFSILFVVGVSMLIYSLINISFIPLSISILFIMMSILSLWQLTDKEGTNPTGRYCYEVTVDDSVSFVELHKKYDVIEQNGKIWTLEDKETE